MIGNGKPRRANNAGYKCDDGNAGTETKLIIKAGQ